jgi:hypothetical protein
MVASFNVLPDRRTKLVLPNTDTIGRPVGSGPVFDLRSAFAQVLESAMGMAKGVNTEGDVLTQTIDGRDLNDMWNDFRESLNFWNQGRSTIVEALTFPVSFPVEDVPQAGGEDFEEASEFGIPKSVRAGQFFSLAYDFKWYDLRLAYTWKFLAEAMAAQVEAMNNLALEADNRLVFSKVLRAIFNNVNRSTDIRTQSFTVYPFYNNDGTVPPKWKNTTHLGTHDHYVSAGGAPITSADLDAMEDHLKHHGYGRQSGATLVLMLNTAELAVVRNFRVATGSSYDFVPGSGQLPWLLPTNTGGVVIPQGTAIPPTVNGMQVAGRYGSWLVVEEDYIPAGYMLGFATGGANAATNPVGFREHAREGFRGLRLIKGREPDYPLQDAYYGRSFGTGVRHRGAGIVMQVAAGAYVIPTDYA